MKKLGVIAAWTAVAIFALVELVHDFLASDPVGYFRREPVRLFYVAGVAIAGGILTLSFHKLQFRAQRLVRIFGLGGAASLATAAIGYFVYIFFSLASMISELGGSVWNVLMMSLPRLLLLTAIAAYYWFACWRVWRT